MIAFIRTHHLHIPPDLVLLIRSLVTIDGVGRTLDPHFDIARELDPFLRELTLRRVSTPGDFSRNASHGRGHPAGRHDAPGRDRHVARIDQARRADRTVRPAALRQPGAAAHRASNTLAVGIVIAGVVVASALVLRVGFTSLASTGFGLAEVLLGWLIWNMSRK